MSDAQTTQLRNIEESTGRTMVEWTELLAATGLVKHGQIVSLLKSEHGLSHGNANLLAHVVRQQLAGGPPAGAELLDAQYRGGKAALRPIHDRLVELAQSFGDDVEVAVQKTGVSLRRRKQFALIGAPAASRVRLGFNLRGEQPTDRLRPMTGMCTHAVDLTAVGDIDDEVTGWLRTAYQRAG